MGDTESKKNTRENRDDKGTDDIKDIDLLVGFSDIAELLCS
jgi:hypothetical protein